MSPYDLARMLAKYRWQTRLVMQKYRVLYPVDVLVWDEVHVQRRLTESEMRLMDGNR